MQILVADIPTEDVAYLESRLPGTQVVSVPLALVRGRLQQARFNLLILGDGPGGIASMEILRQVRDLFDADMLPIIYIVPDNSDRSQALRKAVELRAHQILTSPVDADNLLREAARLLHVRPNTGTLPAPPPQSQTMPHLSQGEWDRQRTLVNPQLDMLDRAARALDQGGGTPMMLRSGRYESRKLAEFLDSAGHTRGVALCQRIFSAFETQEVPEEGVAYLMARLREAVLDPPGVGAPEDDEGYADELDIPDTVAVGDDASGPGLPVFGTGLRLLVVDGDEDLLTDVTLEGVARGMQIAAVRSLGEAHEILLQGLPDIVLLDFEVALSWDELVEFFERMHPPGGIVPCVVLTADAKQDTRLAAVRLGATHFAEKPMPVAAILTLVQQQFTRRARTRFRILVMEDDSVAMEAIKGILEGGGFECLAINDPTSFWETLQDFQPDLVLLDIDMPEVTGLDICRMLRSDLRWSSLPVMFLTAVEDPAVTQEAFECGADDFAFKPMAAEELVQRVANRLERCRLQRQGGGHDGLTGLDNRIQATEKFNQFFRVSSIEAPVSLAVVNVDLFNDVNVCPGQDTGDAVLCRLAHMFITLLPEHGIVARWAGDEFVLGFYGLDRDQSASRLQSILNSVRNETFGQLSGQAIRISFSGGVAEHGRDGTSVHDLYLSARTAMAEVKREGGNNVRSCAWFETTNFTQQPSDVLIIHEDETFASHLLIALGVHGYHGQWLPGGQSVLSRLLSAAGSRPGLVVVLSLDSPDALALLRIGQRDEVLSTARIIALSDDEDPGMATEAERLGAHLVIPNSTPFSVLMHHVRQSLAGS